MTAGVQVLLGDLGRISQACVVFLPWCDGAVVCESDRWP